jgi:Cu/Ag efflux protein CusF
MVLLLLLPALWSPGAMAAEHIHISPIHVTPATPKVEYHGVGVVNRVEPIIGLINISHGEVPVAGWNAYTRDLRVRPKELVKGLVPGMKIKFQLTAIDSLNYVVTALEPVQ